MKRLYTLVAVLFLGLTAILAQNLTGTRIYINPGHGGYDSDDRNITIHPFKQGDPKGFWESQSNLDKGLQLKDMLDGIGATTAISRTLNRTEDDLNLSLVVRMANEFDADFMLSIHSNAGVTNYILQLYAGIDVGDTHVYPTATPHSDEGRAICTIIANDQHSNQANTWAAQPTVRGDKTFARTAMLWDDGYGVLRGLTVPGCISEGSMHDYIPETYRLMNMEYKWLEAWHFMKSFCTYFNAGEIPTGNIAGTIHDSRNKNEASYVKIKNSKDELLPLHKAKVTINPGNIEYTTDTLYNGVFVIKNLVPGTYTAKYEVDGYYMKEETLTVKANETTYSNVMLDKVRNTPPQVLEYSPNSPIDTPVECSEEIIMSFNWDIDETSATNAFSITPAIEGQFKFEDSNHRMVFSPSVPFDVSTIYTVKLDKSLQHRGGTPMTEDFSFQFLTKDRNRLVVVACSPLNGDPAVHYAAPVFTFVFDKRVLTDNLKDAILVYDSQNNEQAKNSRTILNNKMKDPLGSASFQLTKDLVPGELYKVVIDGGVRDVTKIPLVEPFVCYFRAVDAKVENKTVVQDFDGTSLLTYDAAGSKNVTSASVARSTSKKLFGTASYEFKYTANALEGSEVLYKFATPTATANSTQVLGGHFYGDLTGNEVQAVFQAEADVRYIPITTMNYIGWKFAETSLQELPVGVDYQLVGFRVVQKDGPINDSGDFFVDDLLLYSELINSISEQEIGRFNVFPNPASDKIQVTSDLVNDLVALELYSLTGALINRVEGIEMNVSSIPTGTYALRILLKDKQISVPVIITR